MWITAALIGLGVFVLFFDLPKKLQGVALTNMWAPHLIIFIVLVAIHGGSAEGTVVAGIATLVFRWFLHRLARRRGYEGTTTQPVHRPYIPLTREEDAREQAQADDMAMIIYTVIFSITGLVALASLLK